MLRITERQFSALKAEAVAEFTARLAAALPQASPLADTERLQPIVATGVAHGIDEEDDLLLLAELVAERGSRFLETSAAREVLQTEGQGWLKLIQLEALA